MSLLIFHLPPYELRLALENVRGAHSAFIHSLCVADALFIHLDPGLLTSQITWSSRDGGGSISEISIFKPAHVKYSM